MTSMTSPLYGFTEDSVIPEGTIKLVVTLGEPPQMATVMIDFLVVKCPSAFNGVLGRPLLKALKAITSFHCLTIKFPTVVGICQVRGRQRDSRDCYSKSLELVDMAPELPQAIEVEKTSRGLMETNINPHLQEDESTVGHVEELIETQVNPNKPSHDVKIGKGLKKELVQQLVEFLSLNKDVFAWTYVDMIGIHPGVMCHELNIDHRQS